MSDQEQLDKLEPQSTAPENNADYTPWIEAILMVAKHYRLECSKENISLTSHWLKDSPVSDVLRGMARQAGLTLSVIKLKKSELTSWRLPLVVQFQKGQIAVLDTMDQQGQVGINYSGDEGVKSSITEQELLDNITLAVVLRPSHTVPDARIDDYIKPHDKGWFKKIVLRDWRPYSHIFVASFVVNVLGLAGNLFTR